LFIATFSGIYVLHTDSSHARNISGNITFPHIISVDVDNDFILVGVFNFTNNTHEVWRRPTSTITNIISGNESNLPKRFSLDQNYPNPFNPETNIKFSIPGGNNSYSQNIVKLTVYDLLGREVAVLVNSKLQPGTYEYTFNGSKLASGIYFYQLKIKDIVDTKKMLLIK